MKEKGFTLIELLAVIVILAIIALIATPIVLDIIDDTKRSAQLRSAENYIKAAEMAVAKEMMYNATFKADVCNITDEGNLSCGGKTIEVAVSGEKPDGGELTFGSGSVTELTLVYNGDTTIIREGGELLFDDDNKLDENATDASCFDVEPVYEYEIGSGCDDYVQMALDDEEETCTMLVDDYGDLLTGLKEYKFCGIIENISLEQMEEAGVITNVKDTNTVSILNYKCGGLESNENAIRDVIIPSKINGKSVTKIDVYAFFPYDMNEESVEEKLINSVVIPNTVKTIEFGAFLENQLTSVSIGKGVTTIGGSAFYNNQLKSVTIPDSVTEIGYGAFTENQLTSVSLGKGVTTIGGSAFYNNQLTSVTIGSGVIEIGRDAFYRNQLTSVVIKGKSSAAEFENYNPNFGWADGYSDANITWQP